MRVNVHLRDWPVLTHYPGATGRREQLPVEFETLAGASVSDGAAGAICVDQHPTEPFIAMQLYSTSSEAYVAAIWSSDGGALVWAPPRARAIRWTEGGERAIVVRDLHRRDDAARQGAFLILTPLQSEYSHHLDVVAWPSRETIGTTRIRYPTGWTGGLVVVGHQLAAVVYDEQSDGGYVLVDLAPEVGQKADGTLRVACDQGSLIGPVASSDKRLLVSASPVGWRWWAPEELQDETDGDDPPSEGGHKQVATLHVHDLVTGRIEQRPVLVELPAGWRPDERAVLDSDKVYELAFVADRAVSLLLPTGERRTIPL